MTFKTQVVEIFY